MKQQITKLGKANGSTKVELSYTMTIADEGVFDNQSGSGDAYKNKLSYTYKDNNRQRQLQIQLRPPIGLNVQV